MLLLFLWYFLMFCATAVYNFNCLDSQSSIRTLFHHVAGGQWQPGMVISNINSLMINSRVCIYYHASCCDNIQYYIWLHIYFWQPSFCLPFLVIFTLFLQINFPIVTAFCCPVTMHCSSVSLPILSSSSVSLPILSISACKISGHRKMLGCTGSVRLANCCIRAEGA